MIKFNVSIYIPTTKYLWTDAADMVQKAFMEFAGGFTAVDGLGGYVDDNGNHEYESVKVISMFVEDWADLDSVRPLMNELADNVKDLLLEESVLWTAAPAGKVVFR